MRHGASGAIKYHISVADPRKGGIHVIRYATQVNLGVQSFGISPAIRFELSANEHFYPQIRG
ncbi:hypothetical protein [Vibrio vulnificus]|uniref:hypothetical protein n=1 Tax=Vibrio vulnificus TaxID=672 RepID=UPI003ED9AFDD